MKAKYSTERQGYLYINQRDAQISVIKLHFFIRCSACFGLYQSIIRSNLFLSCTSYLVYSDSSGCCVAIGSPSYSRTTVRRIGIYQIRCTAYKVAPDDGLIQSETCRESNEKMNFNHRNLCISLVYILIVR